MFKIYPAVFLKEDIGYSISFPDLDGCFSEGDTLSEAMVAATDVLGLFLAAMIDSKRPLPEPSEPNEIKLGENEFVTLIAAQVDKYRQNKSVKKTLTIPQWLNDEAEERHINFSSILQKALKEELHILEK